jgi:NAD(P)H dehydrogenase (quinone)
LVLVSSAETCSAGQNKTSISQTTALHIPDCLRGCLTIKVFVIYDSKYGNTKLAAESILQGIREVERIEIDIGYVKEIDIIKIADYDAIVFGAPNHMGRPSQTMKKFINRIAEHALKAKNAAVFGTYSGRIRDPDRAVKKLEKMIEKKLPNLHIILPGLSIRVNGIPGPIVEGELPKCVDFGKKIAHQLKE